MSRATNAVLALGALFAVSTLVPRAGALGEAATDVPDLSVCSPKNDTELFSRELRIPMTAGVAPGIGEVRVTRYAAAVCACDNGKLSCGLRHRVRNQIVQHPAEEPWASQ